MACEYMDTAGYRHDYSRIQVRLQQDTGMTTAGYSRIQKVREGEREDIGGLGKLQRMKKLMDTEGYTQAGK